MPQLRQTTRAPRDRAVQSRLMCYRLGRTVGPVGERSGYMGLLNPRVFRPGINYTAGASAGAWIRTEHWLRKPMHNGRPSSGDRAAILRCASIVLLPCVVGDSDATLTA